MWAVNKADLSVQTASGYVYIVMLHYGLGVGLAVADLLPLLHLTNQCIVQTFTESEDTRCCVNTIFPPDVGHVNARNMSRIIV